ncbi:MAG TPA: MMPL family transporter [Stellaceae bacterium]|nr:MMPL family transporter [Stellaceae bacterium]
MLTSAVLQIVGFCTRHPWPVMIIAAVLAIGSALYTVTHFAINTDTDQLLPKDLPWRQHEQAYRDAFPRDQILVVVQGPTTELVEMAADRLAAELRTRHGRFSSVRRPQSTEFLQRSALLFLPVGRVVDAAGRLAATKPLIEVLAADPSLRGVMHALMIGIEAEQARRIPPDGFAKPMDMLSDTLDDLFAGGFPNFSWRVLMNGKPAAPDELRGFIQIEPKLDFSALEPGRAAIDAIRQAADELKLGSIFGATVRLTGQVAINDEQFVAVGKGMLPNLAATVLAVLVILWLALRSADIILAVFVCLCVGLVVTAAAGLLMVGAFNLISVAFGILFIGLAADFCIQFTVRYRSERYEQDEVRAALRGAAARAGGPLALAAAGTLFGFFSFVPTAYRGIAELGLIAGFGMMTAFVATITLLPALLTVFGPPGEPERMGFVALAPADRFLARHRIAVVAGTIIVVLAGMPLLSRMRFDFDPIHLQDPNGEAVRTYRDLITVPEVGISSANIIAPSVAEIDQITQRVTDLPEVSGTRSIRNLVPSDQNQKLPAIQRAAAVLGPAINPSATHPAPSDGEIVAAIRAAVSELRRLATAAQGDAATAASRLSGLLDRLANADAAVRDKAGDALIAPLRLDLDRLRNMLRPERVTVQSVPPELARDWVAADGRARIEVLPKGDPNDTATLRQFAAAVLAIAPDATGTPVGLVEAEHTVVRAFLVAGALAVLVIAIMLWITLRHFGDVLLTLVPLIVAGAVTLEVMVLLGEPLNFANVIALPLLLGVGVAFKIYYITAWRAGRTNLLQSTLTRAVFYSALTTATAFGSLWLSEQPGISSMGKLMALALVCTLAAAVLFQPALMGPPRRDRNVV